MLAGLARACGHKRLDAVSSASSTVAALAHASKAGKELWLANLTSGPQKMKIIGFDGSARLHRLSEGNFQTLAMKPDYLSSAGEALKKVSSIEL